MTTNVVPTCPDHNVDMILKNGRYGDFWGCPEFRNLGCRITVDASGESDDFQEDTHGNSTQNNVSVIWDDGTLERSSWICRYSNVGGSLRSATNLAGLYREFSQCWIASSEPNGIAEAQARRVTSSIRKILQRGLAPPLHPTAENMLIDLIGLRPNFTKSDLLGDLTGTLSTEIFSAANDKVIDIPNAKQDQLDKGIQLGSDYEKQFIEKWVAENLGTSAYRWFVPQPSLDSITSSYGEIIPTGKRVDFLVHKPTTKPFIVEIDGGQHEYTASSDAARDTQLNDANLDVIRIPTSEINAGTGPNLTLLKETWQNTTLDLKEDAQITRALFIPPMIHRLVVAILDGIDSQFLTGSTWTIDIKTDLEFDLHLLTPYMQLIRAFDKIWNGGISPKEIIFDSGTPNNQVFKYDFETNELETQDSNCLNIDLNIDAQIFSTPIEHLKRFNGSIPEIIIRTSRLPVLLRDDLLDPPERSPISSLQKTELEWCLSQPLQCIFAKEKFREGQLEALEELFNGRDCTVLLPTGSGKSLIYQLAGLCLPGRTIVVDPLIALIEDQIFGLKQHGVDRAIGISAFELSQGNRDVIRARIEGGDAIFIFVAPERFQKNDFRQSIRSISQATPINLTVVDEAHCVSEWGHQFRTAYLTLGNILRNVCRDINDTPPPILALTGTASRAVLKDVLIQLGISSESENSIIRPTTFDRPELEMVVRPSDPASTQSVLSGTLRALPSQFGARQSEFFRPRGTRTRSGLIFCPHVNSDQHERGIIEVQRLSATIVGTLPGIYAGSAPKRLGMSRNKWERYKRTQSDNFKANDTPYLVCTNAFGMGIDKPNIRSVIHYGLPGSIESYYQEIGRAGRDGGRAVCTLIWDEGDRERSDRLTISETNLESVRQEHESLRRVDADDITRQLYFMLSTFTGVDKELAEVTSLLEEEEVKSNFRARRVVELPRGRKNSDQEGRERAIYRLMILGLIEDYRVESSFVITFRATTKKEIGEALVSYIRRTEPAARRNSVQNYLDNLSKKPLLDVIVDGARELILFTYDVVVESRRRSFREMYVAARDSQGDGNILRQRVLDYLTMGDISPRLEELVDRETFNYSDWEKELINYESVDDARELRGNAARLLSSSPFHPGLLFARAYAEIIHPEGDIQDFAANFRASLRSCLNNYSVDDKDLSLFLADFLQNLKQEGHRAILVLLDIIEEMNLAPNIVSRIYHDAIRDDDSDPYLRIMALSHSIKNISKELQENIGMIKND